MKKKIFKILLVVISVIILTGCDNLMNTPTKRVETFLNKYQTMDNEVIKQLDDTLDSDINLNDNQKKDYKDLMKKQYQNLTYTVKDETVNGDRATVTVEIEVYDYGKAMRNADDYLISNRDEFVAKNDNNTNQDNDEDKDIGELVDDVIDNVRFMTYKIGKMKNTTEKVKYTIEFELVKKDKKWQLSDIDEITRQKIHGIYNYG